MSLATHFEVQRSIDGVNWSLIANVESPSTSYNHENSANSGINAYFRVRAVINGVIQTNLPLQSSYLEPPGANSITCTYPTTNPDQGFEIHKSLNDVGYVLDGRVLDNITSFLSTGIVSGQIYYFKVRAVRDLPVQTSLPFYSAFSSTLSITCRLTDTQLKLAELYKIQLSTGAFVYYTSHNTNLIYSGNTYIALPIKRSKIVYYSNFQVDKLDIAVGLVGVRVGTGNYTIPQIIDRGWLRKAHIWIYLVDWTILTDATLLFEGHATGNISHNQGILKLECNSILDKLNTQFPKKVYTELCQHNLYSIGTYDCNVNKATFKVTGTVISSTSKFNITATVFNFSSYASGYWLGGYIKFTSGLNIDVIRSVKLHSEGIIETRVAFPDTISSGDTFDVYPGCNKTGQVCQDKFNNFSNFFGFEYIPRPETIYGY